MLFKVRKILRYPRNIASSGTLRSKRRSKHIVGSEAYPSLELCLKLLHVICRLGAGHINLLGCNAFERNQLSNTLLRNRIIVKEITFSKYYFKSKCIFLLN